MYKSKMTYQAMKDTKENAEALAKWGYVSPMEPNGLIVVFDERNQMVSAILSPSDFENLFEKVEET